MVVANINHGTTPRLRCMPAPNAVQAPVAARSADIAGTRGNTAAGDARTTKCRGKPEVIVIGLCSGISSFAASLSRVWKTKDWWIFDLDAKKLFLALTVGDRSLLDHLIGAGG